MSMISSLEDLVLCEAGSCLYFIPKRALPCSYRKGLGYSEGYSEFISSDFMVDVRDPKNPHVIKNRYSGDTGTKVFIGISKPTNTATFYSKMSNTYFRVPFITKEEFDESRTNEL